MTSGTNTAPRITAVHHYQTSANPVLDPTPQANQGGASNNQGKKKKSKNKSKKKRNNNVQAQAEENVSIMEHGIGKYEPVSL